MKLARPLAPTVTLWVILFLCILPVHTLAECQACWTSSPSGGQCQDVIAGSPSLATYENCQGTLQCYRALDGSELCFPRCLGNPCFWV